MFKTSDIYFGAYLSAIGAPLRTTEREGRTVFFVFDDCTDIEDLRLAWLSGNGQVSALTYANSLKSLKQLCFAN